MNESRTVAGYPAQPGRDGYVIQKIEDREGYYRIIRECPLCNRMSDETIPAQGLWNWEHGEFVQRAFPDLTPEQREVVMTGTHPKCWDETFAPDPVEGCPDCGKDVLIDDPHFEGGVLCPACGWRSQ